MVILHQTYLARILMLPPVRGDGCGYRWSASRSYRKVTMVSGSGDGNL